MGGERESDSYTHGRRRVYATPQTSPNQHIVTFACSCLLTRLFRIVSDRQMLGMHGRVPKQRTGVVVIERLTTMANKLSYRLPKVVCHSCHLNQLSGPKAAATF